MKLFKLGQLIIEYLMVSVLLVTCGVMVICIVMTCVATIMICIVQ